MTVSTRPSTQSILKTTTTRHSPTNLSKTEKPSPVLISLKMLNLRWLRGLRSERLFFEPGETKSILEEAQKTEYSVDRYNARVAIMVIESTDPFVDFRVSMEEMVEAHGMMRDNWECLEEMLAWYLRVNGKSNHGYILGAFVDLLIDHLASASSTNDDSCSSTIDEKCSSSSSSIATRPSFTSPLSFSSSTYSDLF